MLYICSDHGGFKLKELLKKHLADKGIAAVDAGPQSLESGDDYPDYVIPVMRKVQSDSAGGAIVICRNGVGVSMLANKFKGIRAALSWTPQHAASTRVDDNTNVLALPADFISDDVAKQIVDAWLSTKFENTERHVRRLMKVTEAEK